MKETRKIEVTPYNPLWVEQFEEEALRIQQALADFCVVVHHVGSTSVPGLPAKPKIDILAVVKRHPSETIKKLEEIGYAYRGEYNIPMHYGFSKRGALEANLHVYQEGHPEIELNLTFRDYLKSHPEVRDAYGKLKLNLLEDKASFEKNNSLFTGYNLGKDAFIRDVLKAAGFTSLRLVKCTHYADWDFARTMQKKYLSDHPFGPSEWNHPNHIHLVLCKGMDMIGYAHIQLQPNSTAAIRALVIEETMRGHGYEKQFLTWIATWLTWQGCMIIPIADSDNRE